MNIQRFSIRIRAHTEISRYISIELLIKYSEYTNQFNLNITTTDWLQIRYYSVDK